MEAKIKLNEKKILNKVSNKELGLYVSHELKHAMVIHELATKEIEDISKVYRHHRLPKH